MFNLFKKDLPTTENSYREITKEDISNWNERVGNTFPEFKNGIQCFGFDWVGRAFAIDNRKNSESFSQVLLFDVASNEVLVIPVDKRDFHEKQLVDNSEAVLEISLYEKWLKKGGKRPEYNECIGFKVPFFLGGKAELKNLEISDIDVYWEITGQVIQQVFDKK